MTEIINEFKNLNESKSAQSNDIPTKVINGNYDIFATYITDNFNNMIENSVFPNSLKKADIKRECKKGSRNEKENYRPVIILPNLSKICGRCMYAQMNKHFDPILFKCQFGFRREYSAQKCLLIMIEKWRASLDQNGTCAAVLADLSKAFDCLPHGLLIAKLHAYGCDLPSLKLLNYYLCNRHQRVKMNNFYSSWADILFGVPQGSILGPILFNIFLSDLFLFIKNKDVASYADATTPYETGGNSAYVTHNLEVLENKLLNWFNDNSMKANPGKYSFLLSGNDFSKVTVGNETISSSKCKMLLGINIDSHLNFKEHVESLCKKASQKINALYRLASSMNFEQRRLVMNSFVICPVVWMFHSRNLNARINRVHERASRVEYKDFDLSFEELLRKDSFTTSHQRNLQKLMTEIFKVKTGIAAELMENVFGLADVPYNLRNQSKCSRSIPCTERYGIETVSSVGLKLSDKVPTEIKNSKYVEEFKAQIKS